MFQNFYAPIQQPQLSFFGNQTNRAIQQQQLMQQQQQQQQQQSKPTSNLFDLSLSDYSNQQQQQQEVLAFYQQQQGYNTHTNAHLQHLVTMPPLSQHVYPGTGNNANHRGGILPPPPPPGQFDSSNSLSSTTSLLSTSSSSYQLNNSKKNNSDTAGFPIAPIGNNSNNNTGLGKANHIIQNK